MSRSMRARVAAWRQHHRYDTALPLLFLHEPVNPLRNADIDALLEQLQALPEPPVLLIIDTWSLSLAARNCALKLPVITASAGASSDDVIEVIEHAGIGSTSSVAVAETETEIIFPLAGQR